MPTNPSTPSPDGTWQTDDPVMDGPGILRSVWRYRFVVAAAMVLAGVLGWFAMGLLPVRYEAEAELLLRDPSSPGVFTDNSGQSTDLTVYMAKQVEVIKSRLVLERASQVLAGGWTVDELRHAFDVSVSADLSRLQIKATAGDAASAARVANSLGEAYGQVTAERVAKQASSAISTLQEIRARLQGQLDEAATTGQAMPEPAREALITQITTIQQREQELAVRAASFGNGVELFDRAELPKSSSRPPAFVGAAAGAVLGLIAAGTWAWWRAPRDQRIQRADDASKVLGAPLLGEIPKLPASRRANDLSLASVGPTAAEAYHFAVASLEHALARVGGTTVALTSVAPGDGKTTTVLFLALAAGHEHRRVRLVDADERTRRLTVLCDQRGAPELVDLRTDYRTVMTGDLDEEQPPLPAEMARQHPSGFFRAHAFRKLLLAVGELADLVLIDTPAALAVAESMAVVEQADAVVAVISRGTRVAQLEALKLRLSFIDTPIIGYIFTRGTAGSSPYAARYATATRADDDQSRRWFGRRQDGAGTARETPIEKS